MHSCAIQVPPTGGKKDIIPPKIVYSNPPNYTKNFSADKIKIIFNEYVVINNVSTEVIMTPSIATVPKFKLKGKMLTISIKDSLLKKNTTYSIQFGKAIADLNEGNALQGYRYVFSTGNYMDSLSISGHLKDALTHKTIENVNINLYNGGKADTSIYKAKPEYYTRDSANGKFVLKNLPNQKFRVLAVQDKNGNYMPDEDELVGIFPADVQTSDSTKEDISLLLSKPYPLKMKIKRAVFTGRKLSLKFNKPVDSFYISGGRYYASFPSGQKDSMIIWFGKDTFQRWLKILPIGEIKDSLLKKNAKNSRDDSLLKVTVLKDEKTIDKYGAFVLQFNQPVNIVNLKKIKFRRDSMAIPVNNVFFIDSNRMTAMLGNKFDEDHNYKIVFPKGSFESIYGYKSDSVYTTYSVPDRRNYGSINIHLGDSAKLPLIFQIVNADNGNVFYEKQINKSEVLDISYITPAKYQLRLIYDRNKNGYWDPLDLAHDIQPEEIVYYPDVLNIKANWELNEIKFNFSRASK